MSNSRAFGARVTFLAAVAGTRLIRNPPLVAKVSKTSGISFKVGISYKGTSANDVIVQGVGGGSP